MLKGYPLREYTWKDWLLMIISTSLVLQVIVTYGALYLSDIGSMSDPAMIEGTLIRISINGSVYGILISLPLALLAVYWQKIPLLNRKGLSKEQSFILRGMDREDWLFLAKYIPSSYLLYIIGSILVGFFFGASEATNQVAIESLFNYVPIWVMFLMICVVAPIGEELFFRGMLLFRGNQLHTTWSRVILSAVLFGFVHSPNDVYTFYTYIGMGFIFSYAAKRTKSIEAAIVYHFINNFVGFLVILMEMGYFN